VSNREDIARLFRTAAKEMGHLNVVMSNSGIEHFNSLESTTEEEIDKTFAVNVKAQFFVAQQCSKYMEDNGRLILISSISAVKVVSIQTTRYHALSQERS
jgi:tetrahydroxynaphthalene reductase